MLSLYYHYLIVVLPVTLIPSATSLTPFLSTNVKFVTVPFFNVMLPEAKPVKSTVKFATVFPLRSKTAPSTKFSSIVIFVILFVAASIALLKLTSAVLFSPYEL